MRNKINIFSSKKKFYEECKNKLIFATKNRLINSKNFNVAFSGGRTPGPIYELFFDEIIRLNLDQNLIHIFLTDERCVSPKSSDSNFNLIYSIIESMKIDIKIHKMFDSNLGIDKSCDIYENKLKKIKIDFCLMGFGEDDGHIASIFNSQDIKLSKQVFSCNPKDVPFKRISLPMTKIIAAKERLIIGSGTKKYERIKNLSSGLKDNSALGYIFNNSCSTYFINLPK